MFKDRMIIVWDNIKPIFIFLVLMLIGLITGLGIIKLLEVTILGEQGVQYLMIGIGSILVGGILLLILITMLFEFSKSLTQFINWLFIEPYKNRKMQNDKTK